MLGFQKAIPVWLTGYGEQMNVTAGFRLNLSKLGANAELSITGASFYKIYLDGKFVHFGPARAGHGCIRIDKLRLPQGVAPVLAIEVVGYHCESFNGINLPSFVAFEVTEGSRVVAYSGSDEMASGLLSGRRQKVMRYSFQRQFTEAYTYGQPREVSDWKVGGFQKEVSWEPVDCNLKTLARVVPFPNYQQVSVVRALVKGRAERRSPVPTLASTHLRPIMEVFPQDELECIPAHDWQRVCCPVHDTDRTSVASASSLQGGQYAVFALASNDTGFLQCRVQVAEEAKIIFFFGERILQGEVDALVGESLCNIVQYQLGASEQFYELETFEMYGLKVLGVYVQSGRVVFEHLGLREFCNPEVQATTIEVADEQLVAVFQAARNTFRQNAVDIFMDCPTRERAGWLCDSYYMAQGEQFFSAHSKVEQVFLENYLESIGCPRLPKGMLPMCYPADHIDANFIPQWAMWFVLQLEGYHLRNPVADIEAFRTLVTGLIAYLEPFENSQGLLERLDKWNFVEWSRANDWVMDINYPTNMLYAKVLELAGRWYGSSLHADKARKIREKIIEESFDGNFFRDHALLSKDGSPQIQEDRSEVCQYYAFALDTVDHRNPRFAPLANILIQSFGPKRKEEGAYPAIAHANALMGIYMRMELLVRWGKYDQLLREVGSYFYPMAQLTGTLWEHNGFDAGSLNHGFASHAAVSIIKGLTGLQCIDERLRQIRMVQVDHQRPCHVTIQLREGRLDFNRTENGEVKVHVEGPYMMLHY